MGMTTAEEAGGDELLCPLSMLDVDEDDLLVFLFGVKLRDAIRELPDRKEKEDLMGEAPLSFSVVEGVSNDSRFFGV